MQTTIDEVLALDKEVYTYYAELLKSYNLDKMDEVVRAYEVAIRDSDGQLTNESIRYFLGMFSYYAYVLGATLSRQALRSDIAMFYKEHHEAQAFINPKDMERKLIREDKQALATLANADATKVSILFNAVKQAVETRIKSFNKLIEALNMFGAMNMSEAKLGGRS
jgi:hypothetical protein